ncbi:MAG: hypothetical protein C4315_01875 [Chloroflexota bacterium]
MSLGFFGRPPVLLALSLIGLALATGYRLSTQSLETARDAGDVSAVAAQLEAEQRRLQNRLGELQAERDRLRSRAQGPQEGLSGLLAELISQQVLAGTVGLTGPGVVVVLDDSPRRPLRGEDPTLYLVLDSHLRDVVNLLWQGGAEAVAINGERLVVSSSIYAAGGTIVVNAARLAPPYEIVAIGPPELETLLKAPDRLTQLKARVQNYGLQFTVRRVPEVTVPPYKGGFATEHLRW